ncbi:MAG TPA: glycoside hydrolase family 9 protein [Polyangiaceae bacterium]
MTPCEDEQDCDGDVCSEALGACVECVADGDCDEQQECIGNTCIGFVPCNEPDDCPTNQVCNEETERCVECVDDGDCGDEQTCIGERCRDACEDSDDCESGTQCQDELGACVDCLDAGDCDESSYCSATGECEPDVCIAGAQACDGVDIVECNADGSAEEPYRSCEDGVCEASGGSASCEAGTEPEPPTNSCGVRGVADAPDLAKAEPAPFDGRDAAESTAAALDDIDNFADGDLGLLAVNGRSGGWFTIGVPDGSISEPTIVTTGTDYAVEVSGNRDADETTALLAASLNHPEGESAGVYDVSFQPDVTFTGVSVWAAGTPGLALRLKLSTLEGIPISDGGLCDETYGPCRDFLGATITLDGEFRRHDVAFDDLVQEGWGQALSGDLTRVRALEFHPAVGSFNFAIDRVALVADSLTASPDLRLNQLGYFSDGPKRAVVVGGSETSFSVVEAASGDAVFTDSLSAAGSWAPAGESAKLADFSELSDPGTYYLRVGDDVSETFAVRNDLLSDLTRGLVKAYYFNRASEALAAAHADAYARPAGHPDTSVVVHATAGSASRPAGNTFSAPGGWYDAGDYGKYIVSSSIATTTLLLAYDHHADVLDDLSTRIPESGNEAPDVLNEARYNLEWMLAMQDPGDGGVHHMLVTEDFPGEDTMPNEDTGVRYAMAKTTSAALDFAATLAHAARTFAPFDEEFSCTALVSCLHESQRN